MANVKWTANQQNAINARNGAVLVSAAAGSGKTAVLVERVIDMITDPEHPVDADRFLVVTYTRAAAGEMKDRIGARLDELLKDDPLNENLHRQQLLLGRAQISTIHSFCSDLVREYFYTLDIPSDFRIADDGELTIIKNQAMQNILERKYSEKDDDFENAVEVFSSVRDDTILQGIVLRLYEFLRSHPFPSAWIKEKAAMYDVTKSAEETEWGKTVIDRSKMTAYYLKTLNSISLELLQNEPKLLNSSFGDRIRDDEIFIGYLIDRLENGSWNDIIDILNKFTPGTLRAPKGFTDHEIKVAVAAYRNVVKDTIGDLKELFIRSNEQCMDDIADLAPVVSKLFEIMELFGEEYSRLKLERSLADFSDLEHWALRLLAENTEDGIKFTEISKEISSRYDYVMVDEYQDANTIQDTIFKAVSDNDRKLFVVGDVKQSIYRFRQAMPEIFIGRKNRYTAYNPNDEIYPAKIILDMNFRSRIGVTEGVNFVFKNLMSESVGDIDYTDEEALVAGAAYDEDKGNAVSFHLLNLEKSETQDRDIEEAKYIGSLIYKMMSEEEITTKEGKRKPTYGDFCILMRGVTSHAPVFEEVLLKMGIPTVSETSDGFFSQHEIQVMLSLLRIIDNPVQDIPLAAVLLSPIFGFTADELAEFRTKYPTGSLYSLILQENLTGNEKTLAFSDTISRLRKIAASVTTDTLLNIIYNKTSYPEIVSASEDGEFKKNNLKLLVQYAKTYENSGYRGVGGFVRFIDRLRENSCDLAAAERKTELSEDAVRIMTIHKSKGLEFPICIVANLNRKFNTDTKNEVLLHNELGLGVRRKDDTLLCRYTTMPREAVALEIRRNEISEELRVLYVALTRAKERLVLIGSSKGLEKYVSGVVKKFAYDKTVSPYTVSSAGCMCDWIIDCLLVHKSGRAIRNLGGYVGDISDESAYGWDVNVIEDLEEYHNNILSGTDTENIGDISETEQTSDNISERTRKENLAVIRERLSRVYEYEEMTKIPVKVSASALAERESNLRYSVSAIPGFMRKGGLSGAEKGTAMHTFVQYCDFERARTSLNEEIEKLVERGFLTAVQGDAINRESINNFLNSNLMNRMLSSDMLEREFRFTVEIPAGLADKRLEFPYSEEPIILQGAVDCLFEENGKIIIVDYKTDWGKSKEELTDMYSPQLKLYKLAIEQVMGKIVSQCVIYSFGLGNFFTIL